MQPAGGTSSCLCEAWRSRITQVPFEEKKGQDSSKCSRKAVRKKSAGELGYVQLCAIPTVAVVGICCLVVTRRNLCSSDSPVTCRFEAVANEAYLLYRPSLSQSQLSAGDCKGQHSQIQTIINGSLWKIRTRLIMCFAEFETFFFFFVNNTSRLFIYSTMSPVQCLLPELMSPLSHGRTREVPAKSH